MGASIGTDDKKSVNVELNIVPFIDLMSCLTAFLLVTAVWVNIAQVKTRPTGKANAGMPCDGGEECDPPRLSLLVEDDQIWIGVSRVNDFESIPRTPGGYDWAKVQERLEYHKKSTFFLDKQDIEIAANSRPGHAIEYQHLVAAMDIAVASGFLDVGITDVKGLSAQPHL